MSTVHKEVQKQIHQDWANREYIEVITASIKRITDFLNSFGEKPNKFLTASMSYLSPSFQTCLVVPGWRF